MKKLDLIDRKILYELDLNARTPATRIAKKLRQSRERVNYRINNLVKKEIIRKFVTMINPAKLGYSIYKMFFKFQNMTKEKEQEAINWLVNNDYIYWVASAKGRWDLNITIFARNINHFEEIMSQFIAEFGEYILEQEFNTTLEVGIMSKDWLLPEIKLLSKIVYVGGEISDSKIDKTDVEILRILANNVRISAIDLAEKIGTTQKVVLYRIKQLEEKQIILGYTTSLNLEKLSVQFFKATVNFNIMAKSIKKRVIEYCRSSPNIGFLIFCVGSWPLELESIVKDNKEFYEVMDKFREAFPEMKGYDTIIFPKEYKFDWMPLCYKATK